MRQRADVAGGERGRHAGEQRFRELRTARRQLVHVDREIRDIPAQQPRAQPAVLNEIPLAEFDKPPEGLQEFEARLHRLPVQRIEHDIDPGAAGCLAHRSDKAKLARVADMIGADKTQKGALRRRAGGGNHRRAACLGDLDRGKPHAARGGVDQHGLARHQPRQGLQRIARGDEGDRQRRRGGEAEFSRDREHRVGAGHGTARQRRRREPGDPVADREALDAIADRAHHPRAFQTERGAGEPVEQRLFRQHAGRRHHVAEIDAGGAHLDLDLARPRRTPRSRRPAQAVEPPRPLVRRHDIIAGLGPNRRQAAPQAEHVPAARGPDNLGFRAGRFQVLPEASRALGP